ncbi:MULTISPECIES: hypothetical protein [unclassified Streptomyces]|uniref:hypothetical protein n=1 Tax=unclassified Streptomyces TaxID=2593676 RepID=UPI0006AFE82C|nr:MULTISPECIES: hypothetical protein [unclassified Streptomyces]KOU89507.1 hypothetical protein ADK93_10945 [Streptomyces sp. XY58]KOV08623.1 hypothetical protein ADK89_07660 [Streptomyces sp. XY37]KOV50750.1 hypothetical protein ADK99_09140 [Streptomyces sp. MMG1064]
MDDEIQLFKDGDGLAVIGDQAAVERFLVSAGLASKDLGSRRLGAALGNAAGIAQAGSDIAAGSGRWVKLTKESAQRIDKIGLRKSATTGLETGVLKGPKGQAKGFVEFAKGSGPLKGNPAQLANIATVMAQLAMQQAMDEIADYLATIDEKVDDVLRAQQDQALAQMIAVDLEIKDALTIREKVGRVSEVTWSKVQNMPTTIAYAQAYALRQLDALAEKTERKSKIGELAKVSKKIESKAREWLAVLAHCFRLQEAFAVLELDRVRETDPHELDSHRLGLRAARKNRMDLISESTERLVDRMHAAAGTANAKVLLHPTTSREVVHARNHVEVAVVDFHGRLGIERDQESLEARRWKDAAVEVRDKALEKGAENVDAARRLGTETLGRAKSATGKLSSGIANRALRRHGGDDEG